MKKKLYKLLVKIKIYKKQFKILACNIFKNNSSVL